MVPTPDDGSRLSDERLWDEGVRPTGPVPDPNLRFTPDQQAAGQHLVDIHDHLRGELGQLSALIEQVAAGALDPGKARSMLNTMTMRQNNWTLGVYCESYCRAVTGHHTLEDRSVFPHLRRGDARLEPVIDRLEEEHHVIAGVIDRVDQALVALVSRPDGIDAVRAAVELLSDTMSSHLSYEERSSSSRWPASATTDLPSMVDGTLWTDSYSGRKRAVPLADGRGQDEHLVRARVRRGSPLVSS